MKTKIKRHSRAVISVVLAISMLISCMMVGIIATDAAQSAEERLGAVDNSESVGGSASADYGANRKFLYINLSGYADKDNMDGIDFYWDVSGNNYSYKAGYVAKSSMTVVASDVYRVDLSTVDSAYKDLSGIKIGFNNFAYTWDQAFYQRSSDNNNCLTLEGASWSTEFNLWYGSSDTALNDKVFLAPDGIDFPLTTSNTFINVVNAAYDSWNSAGSVWSSSSTIDNMIDSNDNIIFKEKKEQNSTTYYALIKAKSSTAAKYSQVLTYSKDNQKLTITSNPPASYNIAVDNADDCAITAVYNGTTKTNGETLTGVFVDETVSITVTPNLESKKVTAISATGEGNSVSGVTNNGDGTYSATLTVAANGTISATVESKDECEVNYSVAAASTGFGTVSAKLQDGTPVSNGTSVYEGTKVIFTATPAEGYGFAGWNGTFSTLLSPYTATISANTTVEASFQLDGYRLYYSGGTTVDMIEAENGWYVSSAKITKDTKFTLFRTGNSTYVDAESGDNSYEFKSDWKGPDKNLKWITTTPSSNGQFYTMNADDYYLLYDPERNALWVSGQSDGLLDSYEVYIKDGTIRYQDNSWSGHSSDYGDAELLAAGATGSNTSTGITATQDPDNKYDNRIYKVTLTPQQIRDAKQLHIKATVKDAYKTTYYVKGFDVNGGLTKGLTEQEFYESGDNEGDAKAQADYTDLFSKDRVCATNPYSDFTLTLKAEDFRDGKMEITPIYFPLSAKSTDFVRFYAYDFTDDVKKDWGGSLAVYPYIEGEYSPYGKYPGQLMAFEDGVYYADIPAKNAATDNPIQGLTMNNYVWDAVHYDLFYGSDQAGNNYQTYDYNEFAIINTILQKRGNEEIANEDIIFSFKYKTKNNSTRENSNLGKSTYYKDSDSPDENNALDYRKNYKNINVNDSQYQWEELTDFYHNRVDIFGGMVDDADNTIKKKYNPIRIISNGYDDNAVGYYATAWALYAPVDASGENIVWEGAYDHYQLFEVMGGQGRAARDYPGESYLIDPKYENRIKLKYGDDSDPVVVAERKKKLKAQMIIDGEKDLDGNPITVDTPDNKIKWPTHIMDCEKVPVMITYEYNVQYNHSNIETGPDQKAYRSDGRWYYSDSRQLIKGNVIVEVANSKKGPFVRDYFQDDNYDYKSGEYYDPTKHTGKTTGVKAYFTNSNAVSKNGDVVKTNASGNTEAWAISDGKVEHDFLLKAEEDPDGEYEFVGWYRLTENATGAGYTHAYDGLEFDAEAKTNDVFVARFVKVPSGNLVVSHTLTGEIGKNEVDCKAKVEVLTSEGTLDSTGDTIVYTYPETTANIKVTSKYIKYDDDHKNQKLRITLETTSQKDGKFLFDKFWEKVTSETLSELKAQLEAQGVLAQVSITNNKAIILVTIGSLFNTTDPENPVQDVNSLPFFSSVKLPTIHYNLTYGYDSMIGSNQQYGAQTTEVKGDFTEQEFNKYIVWDDSITTDDQAAKTGWYKFNPNTYVEFLASKCPYEKNIRRNLTWDYTNLNKRDNGPLYYFNDKEFKFTISASDPSIPNKRINFILPYYSLEETNTLSEYYKDGDGKIQELSDDAQSTVNGVDSEGESATFSRYLKASTRFATPYAKDQKDNFVTAPEVIYNGTTPRYFQYWSVQTVPNYVESTELDTYRRYEVARCYNLAYNFSAYQDYIVEAKYGDTRSTHTHLDSATITFAENGRNQWNKLQGSAKWDQGDRIFSNFIISFDRADKIQLNTLGAGDSDIKTGVVFEQLDTLPDFNHTYMGLDANDWTVQSEKTYFQKYSGENTLEAAEAADHGKADAIKHIKGEATTGTHTYMDSTIKNTNIDNKNRIEFTKAFANINTTNFAPTTRKNYVYRAYAYMQEADGSVTISTPVYFQFYDIATIANATRQTTPAITG